MARRAHTLGVPGVIWRLDESSGGQVKGVTAAWGSPFDPPFAEVCHKPFNGNTDDVAPYLGIDLDVFGSPTYTTGKLGQAIVFAGSAYLKSAQAWSALLSNQPFSFSLWVYPGASNPNIGGFGRCIFGFGNAGNQQGVQLYYNGDTQKFEGVAYGTNWASTGTYAPSNWYHIVYTYDGVDLKVYIDNVNVHTVSVTLVISSPASMWFGRDPYGENRYFNGRLDDFRFWFYGTLDAGDVAELWNGGSGTTSPLSDDRAPTSVAVTGMPFAYARAFDRSQKQYAETYQPIMGSFVNVEVMSFWIKLASLPTSGARYPILSRWTGTKGLILEVLESGGDVILRLTTGDGSTTSSLDYIATGVLNTVDWFQVTGYVYDGNRFLYLDGDLVAQDTGEAIAYDTAFVSRRTLGGLFTTGVGRADEYFDGQIADMCLSEFDPVNNVASLLSSPYDTTVGLRPEGGTIACYNFESPDPAVDEVGNHDLTITETPNGWNPNVGTISLGTFYSLTADTSIFTIAHHADFDGGENPLCIEVFFNVGGTVGSEGTIIQKYDGTSAPFILYINASDHVVARVQDSLGEFVQVFSDASLPTWDPEAPTVRQRVLMYAALLWEPKTKTLGLSLNGAFKSASNPDIDLTAVNNTADVVCDLGYGGWTGMGLSSLRFNRGVKKRYELQSFADGRRFNV